MQTKDKAEALPECYICVNCKEFWIKPTICHCNGKTFEKTHTSNAVRAFDFSNTAHTAPDVIYLNIGPEPDLSLPFNEYSEVSWCADKIDEWDIPYVKQATPANEGAEMRELLRNMIETNFTLYNIIARQVPTASLTDEESAVVKAVYDAFTQQAPAHKEIRL